MEGRVDLRGGLTIHRVAEVCKDLKEGLQGPRAVVVDATGIEEIDVAGVQVLIALQKECLTKGKELDLRLSEKAKEFLSSLGVEP